MGVLGRRPRRPRPSLPEGIAWGHADSTPAARQIETRRKVFMPALAADFDLRQVVISNSMFGPSEIRQIAQAVSADYNNFRSLRDATNELAQQAGRSPAASVHRRDSDADER
jgi:hypothetical protein